MSTKRNHEHFEVRLTFVSIVNNQQTIAIKEEVSLNEFAHIANSVRYTNFAPLRINSFLYSLSGVENYADFLHVQHIM